MDKDVLSKLIGMAVCSDENKEEEKCEEGGDIKIVILQRGWVFVGRYYENGNNCRLEDAKCIRKWGTTKGLGELALDGVKSDTILDDCPTVNFHKLTIVASINCEKNLWKKIIK